MKTKNEIQKNDKSVRNLFISVLNEKKRQQYKECLLCKISVVQGNET